MSQIELLESPTLRLAVQFPDGTTRSIHPLWLRERCTSNTSIDQGTGQRLYNPSELDPQLRLIAVNRTGSDELTVLFSDGHTSRFSEAALAAEAAMRPDNDGLPARLAWNASLATLPEADWQEQPSDALRFDIAEKLLRYGFVVLHNVPRVSLALFGVAESFGFVRDTNFGRHFDVRSVPDANDLAYSSLALDPHVDNPYREPSPGIQLLHCLINETQGGLSTLVDGLACSEALRQHDPDAYRLLTSIPVRFQFTDRDAEHVAWQPHVKLDERGVFQAIHISPRLDFAPLLPPDELHAFYAARRQLDSLLKSAEFEIRFRLGGGDLVMFDNRRLLHGRTAFDTREGKRHLQGCYIDIDGPRSLYRVLSRSQARQRRAAE
ncbi:TauD/TfdA family dioxygenase [Dongia soli]|uniref:TauD/TfdA family dioxygenase n=1 Tax=Dongia soli TaxID=600628 RepID=A0ABU5EKE7_9PROT|nr:TauD/TfdA family dioxygenase [Dongia soli]MDY0885591.1 TauD/TfdA family dioxygenase [Dongia soli]